ncbi:MAG: hypothetical protein CSA95_05460 [Bacteroidetes bacterium]|nr:MAG: hypothetical protein CSA95_05460 [Bacteroidota bacterium]PIE88722.1 MAG: hypothetical protein CSA04_00395 [Bacteroidota bacterium]
MTIHRNNYEAWFLDYLEGNLSADQKSELLLFLEEHPDLREEFDSMIDLPYLSNEAVTLSPEVKGALKRPFISPVGVIDAVNYEDYFIGWHEGALTPEQQDMVKHFLVENPSLQSEFELFGMVKLAPDLHTVCPHKASYKKRVLLPLFPYVRAIASVAAVMLIVWMLFLPNHGQTRYETLLTAIPPKSYAPDCVPPKMQQKSVASTLLRFEEGSEAPFVASVSSESFLEPSLSPLPMRGVVSIASMSEQCLMSSQEEYALLMHYIQIREEMEGDNQGTLDRYASLLGRTVDNLKGFALQWDHLSSFDVIDFGAEQYHKITRKGITLDKEIDAEGNIKAFRIETEDFGFSRRRAI